jgi:hemerythrin-like domain-containing protein
VCGAWTKILTLIPEGLRAEHSEVFVDPVKLIKQDHRVVKGLFRRFEAASTRSERQKLAEEIIEELSVHAVTEEQLLYPALRARDRRMEESVLNAMEEHHAVKLILAELDDMKADDERFAAKMHVVQESVLMHIEEEENELLPRIEKLFDQEESKVLAEAIVVMKQIAPTHPHPTAPDKPPAGLIAGMVAKLSDTGKDLIHTVMGSDKAEGHRNVRRRAKATAAAVIAAKRSRRGARNGRRAAAH